MRNGRNGRNGCAQMAGGRWWAFVLVPLFAVAVYRVGSIEPFYKLGRIGQLHKLGRIREEEIQLDDSIVGYSPKDLDSEELLWDLFQSWMRKHEKSYESVSEKNRRFAIFKDNLRYIHSHNVQDPTPSYSLGLNNLGDLTHEEFKTRYLGNKPPHRSENKLRKTENFRYGDVIPPASIDWRSKGAVTPIKNQSTCGSCWAFSTTGAVEGINAIRTGELVSLSEQQLLDCDTKSDHGCHGGSVDNAFKYIIENGGIDTEKDYPYTAKEGTCQRTKNVVSIDDYADVPENNETALLQAVSMQPVSVAINASFLQFHCNGVVTGPCGTQLNHAVLVVGYGSSLGRDFWIVKNSHGAKGKCNSGYIFMERMGSNNRHGVCGINMMPSYPIKTGPNPPSAHSSHLGGHQEGS